MIASFRYSDAGWRVVGKVAVFDIGIDRVDCDQAPSSAQVGSSGCVVGSVMVWCSAQQR